ncbi:hypothetical protein DFO73_11631 [Cytobacillus oceanisediminis]|uniref:Uncharacterized protein n=2 Tax=Cytobacillus oceanisediminis TaxID=665099 RepID=A0A2V2ZLH1_9BACI|nr:hypothetical protein DFO73_11631 [Cytobacillus oceanisediminis]
MEKFGIIPKINIESALKPAFQKLDYNKTSLANVGEMLDRINRLKEMERQEQELKQQQKEQREMQLNEMIQQIVANTAYLPEMVGLIRKNNEINEEMLGLFQEMTEVLKAQTVEEAEGIVKTVVGKAQETNDALDAMSGLLSYGKLLIKLMFPES